MLKLKLSQLANHYVSAKLMLMYEDFRRRSEKLFFGNPNCSIGVFHKIKNAHAVFEKTFS
jgi:hypothetical protein